jgi:hypothetical protein
MLYQFKKLRKFLDERGYPPAVSTQFQIIKRDLTEEEDKGNIEYREDGIYYILDGVPYKGYLYLKVPDINSYGYPKFHVVECQTIREQKRGNRFRGRYFWHNSNVVELHDRETGIIHRDVELSICQHCRRQVAQDIDTTQDFFDQFEVEDTIEETVRTGIGGYTLNWKKISALFRSSKNYQCERCTLQVESNSDKRFMHVHHKDGNKTNNKSSNLESLCILCHAFEDDHHQQNFGKVRQKTVLKSFIKKYYGKLKEHRNPYLERFLTLHKDDEALKETLRNL